MIRNKLASLLADRNLKISRVANDIPNLSRNTITATSQNETKMIQLDTINELCQYLGISPTDFFEFLPFDLSCTSSFNEPEFVDAPEDELESITVTSLSADLFLKQTYNRQSIGLRSRSFDLVAKQTSSLALPLISQEDAEKVEINFDVLLGHTEDNDTYSTQKDEFNETWNKLTPGFESMVTRDIMQTLTREIKAGILSQIDQSLNPSISSGSVDWAKIKYIYNFSFENAFTSEDIFAVEEEHPRILISTYTLPF